LIGRLKLHEALTMTMPVLRQAASSGTSASNQPMRACSM
jgi:hypothetical protein